MDAKEVMELFRQVAMSQGSYGRLVAALNYVSEEEKEEYLSQFKECETPLDVILLVES